MLSPTPPETSCLILLLTPIRIGYASFTLGYALCGQSGLSARRGPADAAAVSGHAANRYSKF